ncbi:MAG: T9SS type A sorting domain-containing protein [Candidatus Nomurabacteria bacterium]|nr:T9SS type A sorting domain-containing protein [Candidatus Nomurabacteria bacterium]
MKTLKIFLVFLLFFCLPILAQSQTQEVQSVNGWKFVQGIDITDFFKTKSFFFTDHNSQVFANYGNTRYPAFWNFQVTWLKDFSGPFTTPDTVCLDGRFLSGMIEKVIAINVFIAMQNSNNYYFDGRIAQYSNIPLNGSWKTLHWDMDFAKKIGFNFFTRFYIIFQIVTQDSCYTGANILVDNLRGKYPTGGIVIYDSFGDITRVSENEIPTGFVLSQNYPNPFNPTTKIEFALPRESNVILKVYNLLGQEVETLVNKVMPAGNHIVDFNASNLPSGVYMYKLQTSSFSVSKKMLLTK